MKHHARKDMECPHCKSQSTVDAETCDCGYDFRTGRVRQSAEEERRTAAEGTQKKADSMTVWILLGIAVLVSVGIIAAGALLGAAATWGGLAIGWGVVAIFCIWLRVRTRSKAAIIAIGISALMCLLSSMQLVFWLWFW